MQILFVAGPLSALQYQWWDPYLPLLILYTSYCTKGLVGITKLLMSV